MPAPRAESRSTYVSAAAVPDPLGRPLAARLLHESSLVRLYDYVCTAAAGGPAREEQCASSDIVLMRHGAFCRHRGRHTSLVDVNEVAFFSRGSASRVSHPGSCGDRGTELVVAPRVLLDIVREYDPSVDEHPDRLFPFLAGPCNADVFARHRALVMQLEASHGEGGEFPEPLWIDAIALQLAADVLGAAFERHGGRPAPPGPETKVDHEGRVEAAKGYLATRLGERVTLDEVAAAVNASPFHFARMFQRHTGVSPHRYLVRLRLRAAFERIVDTRDELAAIALDAGFSTHSHFTESFRREFGSTPSVVRRAARPGAGRLPRAEALRR